MDSSKLVGIWDVLTEYANSAITALPAIGLAIVVFAIALLVANLTKRGVRKLAERLVDDPSLTSLFGTVASVLIIALGVFAAAAIIFPGLQAGDLVAILGLMSVAVGFAFKDIFENFLAGILILSRRPFKIGDQISVEDIEGTVENITFRDTEIDTYDGERVVTPNSLLFKKPVTVHTAFEHRRSSFAASIAFHEDIDEAIDVILKAVKGCDEVLDDPGPDVYTWEHGDSSLNFDVRYWTKSHSSHVAKGHAQVARAIKYALDEAGIEIPYPYRTVEFFDMTRAQDQQEEPSEAA